MKTLEQTSSHEKRLSELNEQIELLKKQRDQITNAGESDRFGDNLNILDTTLESLLTERETIIKETQTERETIIKETQAEIQKSKAFSNIPQNAIPTSHLSSDERKVIKNINDTNFLESFDGNIFSIILKVIEFFSSGLFQDINEQGETITRNISDINISSMDKQEFLTNAKKIAKEIEKIYGIPWECSVAQAALESGFGKSKLAQKHGNYFGIKSTTEGSGVQMKTKEEYNGKVVSESAHFKTFDSMEASFYGYAEFLTKNPRYHKAFQYGTDLNPKPSYYPNEYKERNSIQFIQEIKNAGYATDSKYVQKVSAIANSIS